MQPSDLIQPTDAENLRLVARAHPTDWKNPTPSGRYNLVVVGGGTAGLVTALGAAGLGAKVALVEKHLLGGDCLNVGCVPSKALLASAKAAKHVRSAEPLGVRVGSAPHVDFPAVMERMRTLRADIADNDSAARLKRDGVDCYLGAATFIGPNQLEVDGRTLTFKRAAICTGGRPALPDIEGIADASPLTNETLFELTTLPKRLIVLGGGPIGCEMAQAFANFGSDVLLLERSARVLSKDDPDASALLMASLQGDGVRIQTGAKIAGVSGGGSQSVEVRYRVNGNERTAEADHILVAAGRLPNVTGLGLDAAGVEYDESVGVTVTDRLQTTNKAIFAAGDVASKYKFTHAADFMARTVIGNALFFGRGKVSALTIPRATYTDPEVAHVGMTYDEAEERGDQIATFTQDFDEVDRCILEGETEGFVRVHADRGSGLIRGATVVGSEAGEMICEVAVAMQQKMSLKELANVIHPYPTRSDALRKLGDQYNRTRLTKLVKKGFRTWMRFRR